MTDDTNTSLPTLFSFLGTSQYQPTRYAVGGDPAQAVQTPFVAVALAQLLEAGEVRIFATELAETRNGDALRQAFVAAGLAPPRFRRLPNGQHAAELWDAFEVMRAELASCAGAPVLFDITHGFRAQPFFAAAVIAYLRGLDLGLDDYRVLYGAFEAREQASNVTPIWDLTAFAELIDWGNALERVLASGDTAGVAGLAESLGRRLARDWARGGRQGPPPALRDLADALHGFGDALATVRVGELLLGLSGCGRAGKGPCAEALLRGIEAARSDVVAAAPPLAPLLDELGAMARPLAPADGAGRDELAGVDGLRALAALVRLYLRFGRTAEAAAVLREAWVSAYAEPAAACPGDPSRFDMAARRRAEQRFVDNEPAARDIARVRNDIEHAGFRNQPAPPKTIREQLERLAGAFEAKLAAGDLPAPPMDASGHRPTTYFITRHAGARDWAEQEGVAVDLVLDHLDVQAIGPGDTVIGTLPVNLIAEVCARGGRYLHLTLQLPPALRGKELTAEDMRAQGARLEAFRVEREG